MKLMCKSRVIASSKKIDGQMFMVKEPGVPDETFPYMMFRNSDRISIYDFGDWASSRCFPAERMDAKELLEELGLDRYDPWEIVKKTGARITGADDFWVDFE